MIQCRRDRWGWGALGDKFPGEMEISVSLGIFLLMGWRKGDFGECVAQAGGMGGL